MKNTNWKKQIRQIALDYHRHAWYTKETPWEVFENTAKKHLENATYAEMKTYFSAEMKNAEAFYADTKTVAALMACNH